MRKFFTHSDPVLPVHHPRVVVETAVLRGADRDTLFEGSGLTPETLTSPDMRVSYLQYGALCANAIRLTGDPALGLEVGRNTGVAQMGALGFLLMNSPTIGAAYDALVRYGHHYIPAWILSMESGRNEAALSFSEGIPLAPFRVFAHEVMFAALDNHGRTLRGGKAIPVLRVEFPYPEPAYSGLYREPFDGGVPFLFDAPVGKIVVARSYLNEPLPFADPATAKLAEQICARLIPFDSSRDGLVAQMRRLLGNELGVPPTLSEIACNLQTSTRTLRRELKKMRTSYKELVDEARRHRAEAWMQTTSMPIERLAHSLGFSTVGSFRRAYKRWTGTTPGAERTRHAKG